MVIKTVLMGFLCWYRGLALPKVRLARQAGLTLIGRAKGSRFVALSGQQRIIFDANEVDRQAAQAADKPSAQRASQQDNSR